MPWDGKIKFEVNSTNKKGTTYTLKFRIPGWANGNVFPTDLYGANVVAEIGEILKINGVTVSSPDLKIVNGYIILEKVWKKGDLVEINFPMDTYQIFSNPKIVANKNLLSVQRGPVLYCAEFADNNGKTSNIMIPEFSKFNYTYQPEILQGVGTLTTEGKIVDVSETEIKTETKNIKLIPYYARSNRGVGEMKLWFPTKFSNIKIESY